MTKLMRTGFLLATLMTFISVKSDAVTITYNGLTPNTMMFQPPSVFGGYLHTGLGGWIGASGSVTDALFMECINYPAGFWKSSLQISYSFLQNHNYKITVKAAKATSTLATPKIQPELYDYVRPAAAVGANSPLIESNWNGSSPAQMINSNTYADYEFTIQPYTDRLALILTAYPENAYTGDFQSISVKSISIEDITPTNPGTFSITASQNSRACLTTGNITFTANHTTNPNNVTVNTYRFYPEPGQWFYNGSDAPTFIDKPANAPTITLTPRACATNLKVSGQAITSIPLTVDITPKVISSTVPQFLPPIIGPDTIKSYAAATASADYSISLGAISACTLPTWSIVENPTPYIQSVVSSPSTPFSATVTKTPYIYGPVVNLKVNLNMCGVNTSVTKPITLDWKQSIFGFASGMTTLNDDDFSVSPNPVSSNVHVNFGKKITEGHIDIISIDGKHVKSLKITGSSYLDIPMNDIHSGIYMILVDDGNTLQKIKIIKK